MNDAIQPFQVEKNIAEDELNGWDGFVAAALREMLKRSLINGFDIAVPDLLPMPDPLPLGQVTWIDGTPGQCRYPSAIAHRIAARQGQDAMAVAHQLARGLAGNSWPRCRLSQGEGEIPLDQVSVQVTPQGWLLFTLSSLAIARWQQHWHRFTVPSGMPITALQQSPALAGAKRGAFPLCDRLSLSLPMLLQWAYGRCGRWLETGDAGLVGDGEKTGAPPAIAAVEDSAVCLHRLLPVVIAAIDQVAAHRGRIETGLRQGYAIAAAIYDVDAMMFRCSRSGHGGMIPVFLGDTIRIAQKVLALMLRVILEVEPQTRL